MSEAARFPVFALTLKQPWAWCVAAGHKSVENRTWKPWSTILGQPIAIHAGAALERAALATLSERFGLRPVASELARGAVVAVAVVDGFVTEADAPDDPWFTGPYGWVLRDVVAIPPVACRGGQGLWKLPPRVRHTVIERFLISKPCE